MTDVADAADELGQTLADLCKTMFAPPPADTHDLKWRFVGEAPIGQGEERADHFINPVYRHLTSYYIVRLRDFKYQANIAGKAVDVYQYECVLHSSGLTKSEVVAVGNDLETVKQKANEHHLRERRKEAWRRYMAEFDPPADLMEA